MVQEPYECPWITLMSFIAVGDTVYQAHIPGHLLSLLRGLPFPRAKAPARGFPAMALPAQTSVQSRTQLGKIWRIAEEFFGTHIE